MDETSIEMKTMLNHEEKQQEEHDICVSYVKKERKELMKKGLRRISANFKENIDLSIRVALGALLVGVVIQLDRRGAGAKDAVYTENSFHIFPSYYDLGGVTYACTMIIFSAGRNMGECIMHAWEGFAGTMIALMYTFVLFFMLPRTQDALSLMTLTLNGGSYEVSNTDLYRYLPFLLLYTFVMLALPVATNTKKFAVGLHILFVLSLINPNDRNDPTRIKITTVHHELVNFAIYGFIGIFGSLTSLLLMLFPYPRIAIRQFRQGVATAHNDFGELLNKLVDSYCFTRKNPKQAQFIIVDIKRSSKAFQAKLIQLQTILDSIWWEQLVGFHLAFNFNKSVATQYIRLLQNLSKQLIAMQKSVFGENYDELHEKFMKDLQTDIYKLQKECGKLVEEIADHIQGNNEKIHLQGASKVQLKLENLLEKYGTTYKLLLNDKDIQAKHVKNNVTLNVFLFNLVSCCEILINFQSAFNHKNFGSTMRATSFIANSCLFFFKRENYPLNKLKASFKVTLAMAAAIFVAVYVYKFDPTAPSSVVYVMGSHVGASFSTTCNRMGGVVAGSVIPSIFKFFICHICDTLLSNAIGSIILFMWVVASMYPSFNKGPLAYVGYVSAFVAAVILLTPCSCAVPTTVSNANLMMTSMGMLIVILFEIVVLPCSAYTLVTENIRSTFANSHQCFVNLFDGFAAGAEASRGGSKKIYKQTLPSLLAVQEALITEASKEPHLWRPVFPLDIYMSVLKQNREIYSNFTLMYSILEWHQRRVKAGVESQFLNSLRWLSSRNKRFEAAIADAFDTLGEVFSDIVMVADSKSSALYIQMKEAFRAADTDGSGAIDEKEVRCMLGKLLKDSPLSKVQVDEFVENFLKCVDASGDKKVTLDEFMAALEGGMSLEVQYSDNSNGNVRARRASSPVVQIRSIFEADASTLPVLVEDVMDSYAKWILEDQQHKVVKLEELLVLNCFISSIAGIALSLDEIQSSVVAA